MLSTIDATNKQVTLTFTAVEWAVLVKARQKWGNEVMTSIITNWISDRLHVFKAEAAAAFQTKYEALDAAKQAQVDALLG